MRSARTAQDTTKSATNKYTEKALQGVLNETKGLNGAVQRIEVTLNKTAKDVKAVNAATSGIHADLVKRKSRAVSIRNWVTATVTAVGVVFTAAGVWANYQALERDERQVVYRSELFPCVIAINAIHAVQTFILTNTGRMSTTIIDFAADGADPAADFEWVDLADPDHVMHKDLPFLLDPGHAVAVRVWANSGDLMFPSPVLRSDGTLGPQTDNPATITTTESKLDRCISSED